MKILVSDVDTSHANTCKNKILEECPTADVEIYISSFENGVQYAIDNSFNLVSRATTGLSDNYLDIAEQAWEANQIGIIHAHGSNSHIELNDYTRLDYICAVGDADGSYGNGFEFYTTAETTQSYATARIAGIIGQLLIDHTDWNFFDARQALRQTASFYNTGWVKEGGFGAIDKNAANAVTNLGLSSPMRTSYSSSTGEITFSWKKQQQSVYYNTVIAIFDSEPTLTQTPQEIIYSGDDETYTHYYRASGTYYFAYLTKDINGNYSHIESYDKVSIELSYNQETNIYYELASGIMKNFNSYPYSRLYDAIDGKLYYIEAPQNIDYPYIVHFPVAAKPEYWMNESLPKNGEEFLWQFNIFDNDASPINIMSYETYIRELLDFADIPMSNYITREVRRDSSIQFKTDDVWQVSVTYRIKIEKT